MYGVIIAAHGTYSTGIYSGLKLVCGEIENLKVVDYLENQTYEQLDANLKKAYEECNAYEGVIFIADLLGGIPFSRRALNFGHIENVRVLAGLNFSMLYSAVVIEPSGDMDEDIENILNMGRAGITVYKAN